MELSDTDTPIEDILPAIEALDDALYRPESEFSQSFVEETTHDVATEHELDPTMLQRQFYNILLLTGPEPDSDQEFHTQLMEYFDTKYDTAPR